MAYINDIVSDFTNCFYNHIRDVEYCGNRFTLNRFTSKYAEKTVNAKILYLMPRYTTSTSIEITIDRETKFYISDDSCNFYNLFRKHVKSFPRLETIALFSDACTDVNWWFLSNKPPTLKYIYTYQNLIDFKPIFINGLELLTFDYDTTEPPNSDKIYNNIKKVEVRTSMDDEAPDVDNDDEHSYTKNDRVPHINIDLLRQIFPDSHIILINGENEHDTIILD